jgi:diguanylate cyclase (GGDEF)-like protein
MNAATPMSDGEPNASEKTLQAWSPAEQMWAVGLFVLAAVLVGAALSIEGSPAIASAPGTAVFFLCYGIFTISIGYQHPGVGYYSFDRVSQVASILVMGPVEAALVNGLASLIFPWHRLWRGVALRDVVCASLYNAGLMASIILICGLAYRALGGQIPLMSIGGFMMLLLVGLVLAMQALNDLGMGLLLRIRKHDLSDFFQPFSFALELGSGVTAVLVALVFNSSSTEVFVLLLVVLSLGMLSLRQFAQMRQQLEEVVAIRTRSLEEKTHELAEQAIRDNLTGLFNRRYADEFVVRQLEIDNRQGKASSIALADIDLFKQINDRYSHAMGDEVLRRVAAVLTARCRKSDIVARYGGEEFLICFPGTDAGEASAICEALRFSVENHDWSLLGLEMPVTICFGVAPNRDGISAQELVKEADRKLYRAKNRGRNLVVA